MSEHFIKIEFYKPKYNLDVNYDGDEGLNLLFKGIQDEVYLTVADDYNNLYCEDVACEISKGELKANVSLGDLVERIVNGEFRVTNGKTYTSWSTRLIDEITFDGKNYADRGFWEEFFKQMPKDEINDFMNFIEEYINIPNIEMDTQTGKYNYDYKIFSMKDDKYGMTIQDDYTIELVYMFDCVSEDLENAFIDMQYSNEDEYYESKKSNKKSLKESYDPTNDILNGLSISMNYDEFVTFIDNQDYRLNVTNSTFTFIANDISINGRECLVIPSDDVLEVIDNHSSVEIKSKNISNVKSVSLKKNILNADFVTKEGNILTVWWEL